MREKMKKYNNLFIHNEQSKFKVIYSLNKYNNIFFSENY